MADEEEDDAALIDLRRQIVNASEYPEELIKRYDALMEEIGLAKYHDFMKGIKYG